MKPMQQYTKADVRFNNGNGACVCNQCGVILSYGVDREDVERYCGECYNKLFEFVRYIATDYFELSHEKVRIQRDDYVRMARALLKDSEDD